MITVIKIKEILPKIRENFSLLVAIPPLLGGLWQTAQLALISPIFLRFFSISQLVADGMFIGLILIYIILIPLTIASFISNLISKIKSPNSIKISLLIAILCILISAILLFYLNSFIIYLAPIVIFLTFLETLVLMSIAGVENQRETSLLYSLSVLLLFVMTLKLITEFSKSSISIENVSKMKTTLRAGLPKSKIRYFNDKYIFVDTDTTKNIKIYRIIKFEELTDD